jgi:hypothetical protein
VSCHGEKIKSVLLSEKINELPREKIKNELQREKIKKLLVSCHGKKSKK